MPEVRASVGMGSAGGACLSSTRKEFVSMSKMALRPFVASTAASVAAMWWYGTPAEGAAAAACALDELLGCKRPPRRRAGRCLANASQLARWKASASKCIGDALRSHVKLLAVVSATAGASRLVAGLAAALAAPAGEGWLPEGLTLRALPLALAAPGCAAARPSTGVG